MTLSRRDFCAMGAGALWLPLSSAALAGRKTRTPETTVTTDATSPNYTTYQSTLVNGYTPSPITWAGRR